MSLALRILPKLLIFLSRDTVLKELIMKGCEGLEQTPESVGGLSCLRKLDSSHCDGLMNLQIPYIRGYCPARTLSPETSASHTEASKISEEAKFSNKPIHRVGEKTKTCGV